MALAGVTLDQFKARLTRQLHLSKALEAIVYRSSTPKYSTEQDLLTGEGSRWHGGRWNPIGIAVVYASLTPESAMAETLAHNRYYGIPIEDAMPRTFVAIAVRLQAVLDFRDGAVRQRLHVSLERILTVDWRREAQAGREPITQTIGRAAHEVGLEGLIVPSATNAVGHNVVVFPEMLQPGSEIRVLHPERLAN